MRVEVAVGVIFNRQGDVLIAQRLNHRHLGNCWEFPGGKVELGESMQAALKRELQEEIGIDVTESSHWFSFDYDYPDKALTLHIHKVTAFKGEPSGLEGQPIRWISPQELESLPFPQANVLIKEAILALSVMPA